MSKDSCLAEVLHTAQCEFRTEKDFSDDGYGSVDFPVSGCLHQTEAAPVLAAHLGLQSTLFSQRSTEKPQTGAQLPSSHPPQSRGLYQGFVLEPDSHKQAQWILSSAPLNTVFASASPGSTFLHIFSWMTHNKHVSIVGSSWSRNNLIVRMMHRIIYLVLLLNLHIHRTVKHCAMLCIFMIHFK